MLSSALLAVNSTHVETTPEVMREAATAAGSHTTPFSTNLYHPTTSGKELPFKLPIFLHFKLPGLSMHAKKNRSVNATLVST